MWYFVPRSPTEYNHNQIKVVIMPAWQTYLYQPDTQHHYDLNHGPRVHAGEVALGNVPVSSLERSYRVLVVTDLRQVRTHSAHRILDKHNVRHSNIVNELSKWRKTDKLTVRFKHNITKRGLNLGCGATIGFLSTKLVSNWVPANILSTFTLTTVR